MSLVSPTALAVAQEAALTGSASSRGRTARRAQTGSPGYPALRCAPCRRGGSPVGSARRSRGRFPGRRFRRSQRSLAGGCRPPGVGAPARRPCRAGPARAPDPAASTTGSRLPHDRAAAWTSARRRCGKRSCRRGRRHCVRPRSSASRSCRRRASQASRAALRRAALRWFGPVPRRRRRSHAGTSVGASPSARSRRAARVAAVASRGSCGSRAR